MGVKLKSSSSHDYKPPTMGVLKKVKKRLGLSGRGLNSGGLGGPNNLPPLLFHQVHGDNIQISCDGRTARRVQSFCKGISFSARPVKISERVCVKFLEVSNNWSGVIRFGFTSNDPYVLRYCLPRYSCPDLTNKPGFWAKALSERFCEKDIVLHYYVTNAGDVHFGINGEEKGVFFCGVDTRSQLWAMVDIYGNTTAVELVDCRYYLNNRRVSSPPAEQPEEVVTPLASLSLSTPQPPPPTQPVYADVQNLSPPPRTNQLQPISIHPTKGRNAVVGGDGRTVWRRDLEFCCSYVFTARPIQVGEKIVVEVCSVDNVYLGSLSVGVTSCDPAGLSRTDLPDEAELLLDRPEYWSLERNVIARADDILTFCVYQPGQLTVHYPGQPAPVTLMHVDLSTTVWMFFDVYGSTKKIKLIGSIPPPERNAVARPSLPPPSSGAPVRSAASSGCCSPVTVTTTAAVGGGTVLVVNLPPAQYPTAFPDRPGPWPAAPTTPSDCSVCYERTVDSVLYTCGHMCMCYDCAVQLWKVKGDGHCPLCRAVIRDVIRTFRS